MIISHQNRYLFVEIPHTASTAISNELCEKYGGERIYHKHELYESFLRKATPPEKDYFVFTCIRNPMDIVVTRYFKRKADHQGFFTNPEHWREYGGHLSRKARREFEFIVSDRRDFEDYFLKFYKLPFDHRGSPHPKDFDFIIRFESLQNDFSTLLRKLGIHQVRPIPLINKTSGKEQNYIDCYSIKTRKRASWVFGPCMELWGYEFPVDWQISHVPQVSRTLFYLIRYYRKKIHNFQ